MKVPKKIQKEIKRITFIDDAIRENYHSDPNFIDNAPEMWDSNEKEMFDVCIALEDKIKEKVLTILGIKDEETN